MTRCDSHLRCWKSSLLVHPDKCCNPSAMDACTVGEWPIFEAPQQKWSIRLSATLTHCLCRCTIISYHYHYPLPHAPCLRYWKASLLVHPDKCRHPSAIEAFKRLNDVAKKLQDPEKVRGRCIGGRDWRVGVARCGNCGTLCATHEPSRH